jgi:hypothetical protein
MFVEACPERAMPAQAEEELRRTARATVRHRLKCFVGFMGPSVHRAPLQLFHSFWQIHPSLQLAGDERGQVGGAAGVTPLVVVPSHDLHHIV